MTKRELLEDENFKNADMDDHIFLSVDWYLPELEKVDKQTDKEKNILVLR